MLYHKCRSACGEIIHVRQILTELRPLKLRIFMPPPYIVWHGGIKCLLCPSFRHSVIPSFRPSVIPSFRPSVIPSFRPIIFVFSTPPTSLHRFEWNLVQMLYHKCRSACGEIIYVRQILTELWPLKLRFFAHFSLSSQLLLHSCMDLNETWQGCCTTSVEVHVGR